MMQLHRRVGETVVLTLTEPMPAGTRVVIEITDRRSHDVGLGFTADRSIMIDRGEVDARKRAGVPPPAKEGDSQ